VIAPDVSGEWLAAELDTTDDQIEEAGRRWLALQEDVEKEQRAIQRFHSRRARWARERKGTLRQRFRMVRQPIAPRTRIRTRSRERRAAVRTRTTRARSPARLDDDDLASAAEATA
jgi:hypothetical protein